MRFFSKTDKTPKERFFKPTDMGSSDETSASSGQTRLQREDSNGNIRLLRKDTSLDDVLNELLENIANLVGEQRERFLNKLVQFIKQYPELVNRAPKKFHSNALELIITLGEFKFVPDLLSLKAEVRQGKEALLERIEHLLPHHKLDKEKRFHPTPFKMTFSRS
jgi:hypothetical protein